MAQYEKPILIAVAVVAVLILIGAVLVVIFSISSDGTVISGKDCVYVCGTLPVIPGENCTEDIYGNCTPFRLYTDDNILYKISPTAISYLQACAGLCNGTISTDANGNPICDSSECQDGDCDYYTCINQFKPNGDCNSLCNPIGCADNIVYYPYQVVTGTPPPICVCSTA